MGIMMQKGCFNSLTTKADDKILVCEFVKSKLYHIENSKTRGQRV